MIGPATDRDLPGILRLAGALWDESPVCRLIPLDMDRIATFAYNLIRLGTLLVSEDETGYTGFLAFSVSYDTWTGIPCATEVALYVDPAHRKQGLAQQLIACAEANAIDHGARWFHAGTSLGADDNPGAVYERAGFTEVGRTYRKALAPRYALA